MQIKANVAIEEVHCCSLGAHMAATNINYKIKEIYWPAAVSVGRPTDLFG